MARRHAHLAGTLVAASPIPLAIAGSVYGFRDLQTNVVAAAATTAAVICTGAAGIVLPRHTRLGRALVVMGVGGLLVLVAPVLRHSPPLALAALLAIAATLGWLWDVVRGPRTKEPILIARVRSAAVTATIVWIVALLADWDRNGVGLAAVALSFTTALVPAALWAARARHKHPIRVIVLLGFLALVAAACVFAWGRWGVCLGAAALAAAGSSAILPRPRVGAIGTVQWWEPILARPERLLVVTFLILCLIGTFLLSIPVSAQGGRSINLLDALFTSVSAVCVTGLIVLDTPVDFTSVGQVAILFLIQLGGIGIMAFSAAAFQLLGRRMSLRHEGTVATLMSSEDRSQLFTATRRLIRFTFAMEALGSAILVVPFLAGGDSPGAAVWRAVFTSVSAFCNAGFALQSDSLVGYRDNPVVLHVVAALIVIGGVSPVAAFAIPKLIRRRKMRVVLEAKLALTAAAVLLVTGFVYILATEWTNTLGELPVPARLNNAWFQSVTLRTAGFNSIDITALQPATVSLMIIWMFIGGGPGGTAGGIKTTTAAVLLLALVAAVRGRWVVTGFGRSISHRTVYKAGAVALLGALSVFLGLLALELTQTMPAGTALFEVVSALGTVGLSTGGTPMLDGVGKLIIIVCMFVGRVGPLTLFMFLTERQSSLEWDRPEEEIKVG
ncbi:MAG: potassium transporter TrkG [bacterium]